MSRGLGFCQRAILTEVAAVGPSTWTALADIAEKHVGQGATTVAWRRAAHALSLRGPLDIAYAAVDARRRMLVREKHPRPKDEAILLRRDVIAVEAWQAKARLQGSLSALTIEVERLLPSDGEPTPLYRQATGIASALSLRRAREGEALYHASLDEFLLLAAKLIDMSNLRLTNDELTFDLWWEEQAVMLDMRDESNIQQLTELLRRRATARYKDELRPTSMPDAEDTRQIVRRRWLSASESLPMPS